MAVHAHHANPLVLTLTLDATSQKFLTSLRTKYFPSHRNHLAAHVTLFHAIPAHRQGELDGHLSSISSGTAPWDVFIGDPRKMGNRGVMVTVRDRPSRSITDLHAHLIDVLKRGTKEPRDRLTEQDSRHGGRPHVTVLNKAESEEEVEKCLEEVQGVFEGMKRDGEQFGQVKGKAVGLEL